MNPARGTRAHTRASRAWFGSVLILCGGALNMMAFVTLGTAGHKFIPSSYSETRPAEIDTLTATVPSMVRSVPASGSGTHHHADAANAAPDHNTAGLRPLAGELSAGHQSVSMTMRYQAGMLIEDVDAETPPAVGPAPDPTPTPLADMPPATHIAIAAVGIDASIVEVTSVKSSLNGRTVFTWSVADWAAGHHDTSAAPGEQGNIVLSGHDDVRGEVFRGLHDISLGDQVLLTSPAGIYAYIVTEIHLREYRDAPLEELIAAGEFLAPMPEARVTLVTCWPYGIDTHRMIVVAKPI